MPRLTGILPAEGVTVDAITGRLTVFNLLDFLLAPKVPARAAKLALVTTYEGEAGERFWERIVIVLPSSDEVRTVSGPTELCMGDFFHRSIHSLSGVHFASAGRAAVVVQHAPSADGPWTEIGRRRFDIRMGRHLMVHGPEAGPQSGQPEQSAKRSGTS